MLKKLNMTEIKEENKEKPIGELNKIRCSQCNSSLVYLRLKTNELCCRHCGNIEKYKGANK